MLYPAAEETARCGRSHVRRKGLGSDTDGASGRKVRMRRGGVHGEAGTRKAKVFIRYSESRRSAKISGGEYIVIFNTS